MGGFVSCRDQTTQLLRALGVPGALVGDLVENIKTGAAPGGSTVQALQFYFGYQKAKDVTFEKLQNMLFRDFKVSDNTLKSLGRMAGQQVSELFAIYEDKAAGLVRLYVY